MTNMCIGVEQDTDFLILSYHYTKIVCKNSIRHLKNKTKKHMLYNIIVNSQILFFFQVKCEQKIYHPNIDLEGNVCLNILREDWKPVLTINSVVYGLQYLFLEPNPDDPLNKVHNLFDISFFFTLQGL